MQQFIDVLKSENKNTNILFIDLNDFETLAKINTDLKLNEFLSNSYKPNNMNYFFIDEIQEIKNFQIVINS
jgi:predicted AAA+ superfamily ATPase